MRTFGIQEPDFPSSGCALVFGASGGIGGVTAGLLAERGCNVVITYRSRTEEAEKLAVAMREFGREATAVPCDVIDPKSVASVVDAAQSEYGRIHTVVSATGLPFAARALVENSDEDFAGMIHTDVFGFFNIAKATVPALREGGGGSITAIATTAIARTLPMDGLSSIPKAAVVMAIRELAIEEARAGVRANAVGPGVIDAGIVPVMSKADKFTGEFLAGAADATPLGRLGEAEEVAEAIAFLASNKASYITGNLLLVDGGLAA